MILGIGSDLVDIRRIGEIHARYGDRFVQRLFTPAEQAMAASRVDPLPTYAKRFAAKEACAKALGTGIRGIFFRDMGVVNTPSGQPVIELTGGALKRLGALTPQGMTSRLHLSLTDEGHWAQAYVIIEAIS